MQRQAMREAFRVAKPSGTVIFVENFEEPLIRMNLARERYGAGATIRDQHNLVLNLQETLAYSKKLGWNAISIQGNTLASFGAFIILGRFIGQKSGQIAEGPGARFRQIAKWALYLAFSVLTWLDDCFGARLPLFGKDIMVVFKKS
jgi:hypothetical protein